MTLTIQDAAGRTVRQYDALGNLRSMGYDLITDGSETTDRGTAVPAGLVITTSIDATGARVAQYADAAGRQRFVKDAAGHWQERTFDANGNVLTQRDANDSGSAMTYDARDRQTARTTTGAGTEIFAYDARGSLVSQTDALGHTTTHAYDALGRKTATTDRIGATTTFTYDKLDRLLAITDAEGGTTTYGYDARGLLVEEAFPGHVDGSIPGEAGYDRRVYTYDAARRLATREDQAGLITSYSYDLAGRLLQRAYGSGHTDSFAYDRASRLIEAASGRYDNLVTRSYDAAGRLAQEALQIDGTSYPFVYGHDAEGRRTSLLYSDGVRQEVRTYTTRGQLAAVALDGADVTAFAYDAGGRETARTLGNGIIERREWTAANRLERLYADQAGIVDFTYTYDLNQRKTREADGVLSAWSQDFSYDAEDRLIGWQRDGMDAPHQQQWNLTPVGDWDTTTIDGVVEDREHNAVHELLSIDGASLTYDAKGNLETDPTKNHWYFWDEENRLRRVETIGGTSLIATYRYDALGRRVQKTVDGVVTTYAMAGAQVMEEHVDGQLSVAYAYGAYVDEPLVQVDAGGTRLYYHRNHLYSVSALTTADGIVTERYAYDAYGERLVLNPDGSAKAGLALSSYGFTGRRHEDETGLMYFRARYYDGELGRYIGRSDCTNLVKAGVYMPIPSGGYFDGWSKYVAAFAMHGDAVDPTGLPEITVTVTQAGGASTTTQVSAPGGVDTTIGFGGTGAATAAIPHPPSWPNPETTNCWTIAGGNQQTFPTPHEYNGGQQALIELNSGAAGAAFAAFAAKQLGYSKCSVKPCPGSGYSSTSKSFCECGEREIGLRAWMRDGQLVGRHGLGRTVCSGSVQHHFEEGNPATGSSNPTYTVPNPSVSLDVFAEAHEDDFVGATMTSICLCCQQ